MMKAFKGFNKDLKCHDFQYEIGKEYETTEANLCKSGFHACEYPLDIFNYYGPDNRFCEVELDGVAEQRSNDSKITAKRIKINAEIGLPGLAKAAVEYILERIDKTKQEISHDDRSAATNTGDYSAAANTGDYSAATNTGNRSAATNTGNFSAATNTGNYSAATNTGYYSAAANTGYMSAATNTGYMSAATNTGYYSAAANTGYMSAATNTGYYSAATNTGDYSAAANTGDYSAATNTGYMSAATNTGYMSAATNTGNFSAATNTGYYSAASVKGKESIAIAAGIEGKASGALGCYIVLAEWRKKANGEWSIKTVKSAKVDGKKIKADTFYKLEGGKFVEAETEGAE